MNREQAKEILMLYRPGTADAEDPSFAEALRLCERDPELKRWFDDHCAVYRALRERMRAAAPAGLKEQIISERKAHLTPVWRRPALLAAMAMFALLAGLVYLQLKPTELPIEQEQADFNTYRSRMVSSALRLYRMDLETNNLEAIRGHLAQANVSNYTLPEALPRNANATGCAVNTWQGKPVAMICFNSGPPSTSTPTNDLWLFVIESTALPDAPATATPVIERVNRTTTATWTQAGTTYVLVANGNEQFIRRFL